MSAVIEDAVIRICDTIDWETLPTTMSKADALMTLDAVLDHIRSSIDALVDEIKEDAESDIP